MRKKSLVVLGGLALMIGLSGCAGKDGKTGPMGPAGPGSQVVYTQNVTPQYAAATMDLSCPAVTADANTGQTSTVVCYLTRSGYNSYYALPLTIADTASGSTTYSYKIAPGIVTLMWTNSASQIPSDFQLRVTVVNQ